MSIKNLFTKPASIKNATSGSKKVESKDFILKKLDKEDIFVPYVDFSSASNFAKYGSAKEYYSNSIKRIYDEFPYDGSKKEKVSFEISSSYLDNWIFDNKYPKTNGYVKFSYAGWGTAASITDGYGIPNSTADYEYIYTAGGIHTASNGMIGTPLYKVFNKSVIYDSGKNRTTPFVVNPANGVTVEFWLKKDSFDVSKTEKEVVLDLWNGNASSSSDYGRFTLALTSSAQADGSQTFIATMQSGTNGFYEQTIGTSTITTGSLSSWHHYALSFKSASAGVTGRIYVDGDLNEKKTLGSTGVDNIGGLINGHIGSLITSPSGSSAAKYSGKLSASLDDFRFWKARRSSEEIYDNWYTSVGGGTNTDDANIDLGIYYKFNEGVVGNDSTDSKVLDYSGRISNGQWTGYSSGARSTNSAFVESGLVSSEPKDPIIYKAHPDVSSLITEMETSGSEYDRKNTAMLYNTIPQWIREEDEDDVTKKLLQIVSSYFDTLHAQITALPHLKSKTYPSSSYKPLPFAHSLLEDKGMVVPNLFVNSTVIESFGDRDDNQVQFEQSLQKTKNLIYTNIYNNLESIYKSKGTENSIRNLLRCFGIDDKVVKLNLYTDSGTHYFNDKYAQSSEPKKYINFNQQTLLNATIFQTSSVNNGVTYLSGSSDEKLERYSALTAEVNIIVPKKKTIYNEGHFSTSFLSSSIFGMHQAITSSNQYTWASDDLANFQVYLVRDEVESNTAKFVLKNQDGTINLESDYYNEIYNNQNWNVAVRIKPDNYPFGGNVVTSSNSNYTLEFYGVSHAFNSIDNYFLLTSSMNYASGSSYMSNPKRFYLGAHRTNFTGSALQQTDLKIGRFGFWLDHLDDSIINQHNLDIKNRGNYNTTRPSTMFAKDLTNVEVPTYDLFALDWNFDNITTTDGSGLFDIDDVTSGSVDTRYGWVDNITRRYHAGLGYGFAANNTSFISNEFVFTNSKELPEVSYTSGGVTIKGEKEEYFIKDEDVSDNFMSLEKSMYAAISEEMIKVFSSIKEMSNLIGKPVDRYRVDYKDLKHLAQLFFEDVEADPDLDKYTEYFKWIDSAISKFAQQLFPINVRHSKNIDDIVESHILERNKYQNKFPLVQDITSTESPLKGVAYQKYKWKTGHAPLGSNENENCVWQKDRKERTDIADRETIRQVLNNHNNAKAPKLAKSDLTTYEGSTYAVRKLSKPYSISQNLKKTIHAGVNYSAQKDRDYVYGATNRHSRLNGVGIPVNVIIVGAGPGQGIELPQECDDVSDPNFKEKYNITAYIGKESSGGASGTFSPINDSASYNFALKGEHMIPFNIISGTVNTGYNALVSSSYKPNTIFTNIHSDTTNFSNDIPLQGPFAKSWVGGHQSRHVSVNRFDTSLRDDETGNAPPNNIQNLYTRPEAWRLLMVESVGGSDGAFGLVDSQYGVTLGPNTYPDINKKSAVYYRDGRIKRPVNVSNIQTTTASLNHGNYKELYEVVSTTGKHENNSYFVKNSEQTNYLPQSIINSLPKTTNPMTLVGQAAFVSGNVFGTYQNNMQPDDLTIGTYASGSFSVTASSAAADGDTLTIGSVTLEIDDNGSSTPGNIRIDPSGTNTQFVNRIISAITGNTNFLVPTVQFLAQHTVFHLTSSVYGTDDNVTLSETGTSFFSLQGAAGGSITSTFDVVIPRITGSNSKFVISSRFSAPGGPEIQSYGYLDAYSQEYSAYNHLVFRNYTVRVRSGGDPSENQIGIIAENGNDGDPERTNLTQFSGKFGTYSGSAIPSSTYTVQPSIYKQQRNTNRRLESGSTLSSPTFIERHDNMLISTPIPRSEFQYNWITSSLGNNYSYTSGKQRIFGYAPRDGILSSSVIINGDSGFVPAITFPTASEIFGE